VSAHARLTRAQASAPACLLPHTRVQANFLLPHVSNTHNFKQKCSGIGLVLPAGVFLVLQAVWVNYFQAVNIFKVIGIAAKQGKVMHNGGGCNDGIGQFDAVHFT
jgi:hypothetical protein